ncbi:MAG: hypothetical protein IRZ03_18395 [Acidobacterium ailaaui]|nr:hypothetical protein [Pseudacidobacterium ailaaui]
MGGHCAYHHFGDVAVTKVKAVCILGFGADNPRFVVTQLSDNLKSATSVGVIKVDGNMKLIVGTISFLAALGLILRYGGSSHALAQDIFGGVNNLVSTLTLQKFPGNNPSGVTTVTTHF